MLRTHKHDPDIHKWVSEVRCHVSEKRTMVGLRMSSATADWFENSFMDEVSRTHAHRFGMDGSLLSLMTESIGNESAELFSTVVYGIGCDCVSMYSLGRVEWLSLELVTEALKLLQSRKDEANDKFWNVIEQKFHCKRSEINLSIAFAPHKMRKLGDDLETSAAGAGERADVLLLAWPNEKEEPSVLGWAYHTTNAPPGTASMRRGQHYPETRILWKPCAPLPELMHLAAQSLVKRYGLSYPTSATKMIEEGKIQLQGLTLNSLSADVLETINGSSDDSEDDAGPEM